MEISQLEQTISEVDGAMMEQAGSSGAIKDPSTTEMMKQLVEMQRSFIAVMSSQRMGNQQTPRRDLGKKRGQFVQGLDPALVQDRLRKGLCIKCGEKGHMKNECPNGVQVKPLKE